MMDLVRQPLIQFLLLGGLLFALDHYLVLNEDDPRHILIDDNQLAQLIDIFKDGQGRQPSPVEVSNLVRKWSQNEILYREAVNMGLDKGDDMVRNRLILKIRNVLFGNVLPEEPTEADLRDWLEQNRVRFDTPERFDFEQFALEAHGDETSARALAVSLGSDAPPVEVARKLRRYEARPGNNVTAMFGEDALAAMTSAPVGQWTPVQSDRYWHVARITKTLPPESADFETLRNLLAREWKKFSYDMQLADQTSAIASRYSITVDLNDENTALLNAGVETTRQRTGGSAQSPNQLADGAAASLERPEG